MDNILKKYRKRPVEIEALQLHMSNMDGLIQQMRRDGYEVETHSEPPMRAITGIKIKTLKVDGGASRDQFLMQFQADILDKVVQRPAIRETTALGAAYLAGLATGVWKSREEITHLWSCNQLFEPKMDAAQREELLEGWHKAVGRSQDWAKH